MTDDPIITGRRRTVLSPWVTLVERTVGDGAGAALGAFHSLDQADYVNILALTAAKDIVLVEQYRPAREGRTLELPGGLLDPGETPASCAARELAEETGFRAAEPLLLGRLSPDPGRLDNRVWCFFAGNVAPIAGWRAEPGVTPRLLARPAFIAAIESGTFDHAMHIGIVGLALLRGLL
ncbi:MAG: NUDIX hydrolase [Alphaproteobacteria bacterium]|nr:NUDIX hydrolase [Alphaproteobacteria bacterium]